MAGDNEVLAGKEMNLRCRFQVESRVGSSVLHNQNSTKRSEASTRCAFGSRPKEIPARENRWKRSVCIDSMNKYCTGLIHGQNSPKRHNNGGKISCFLTEPTRNSTGCTGTELMIIWKSTKGVDVLAFIGLGGRGKQFDK